MPSTASSSEWVAEHGGVGVVGWRGSGAWPSREGAHWRGMTRAGLGCGPGGYQGAVTPDASVALTDGLRLMVTGLDPKLAESQLLSANLFVFLKMRALLKIRRVLEEKKKKVTSLIS